MLTPYDWQESIAHRAEYVQSRLATGSPVLAISLDEGILLFTVRRQARKIFEVYDRLAYSAIGQQSDVESMRVGAIDFAHQEGFQRSESDVTIQRVVSALSQPLKKAFGDFTTSPFVVRSMFAQVGPTIADDIYQILDYDGDYTVRADYAYLAGSQAAAETIKESLPGVRAKGKSVKEITEGLKPIWARAIDPEGGKSFESLTKDLTVEVALISRQQSGESRFRLLSG